MGAGIVILFWLLIFSIGASLWLGSLWLFVAGRRRQSSTMTWLGGVPLAIGSLFAIVSLTGATYGFLRNRQPANVYEMSFGSAPTRDVTNLQSSFYNFADTGRTFLKFQAAPSTVDKLTKKMGKPLRGQNWQDEDFQFFRDSDTPNWWNPSKIKGTRIFTAQNRSKHFAGENEIMVYEPKTGQIYYAFIGVD